MQASQIFAAHLIELASIAGDAGHARAPRACAILRALLLDGTKSLFVQANRPFRIKPKFEVTTAGPAATDWLPHDELDPSHHGNGGRATKQLGLDGFLGAPIARLQSETITTKDLILCGANVLGGVHAGAADSPAQRVVIAAESASPGSVLTTVRAVSRIVLNAMEPLRDAVLRIERFYDQPGFGLVMGLFVDKLDVEGDVQICSWGSNPRVRFFVDRGAQMHALVYSGETKTVVALRDVPVARPFFVHFFAIPLPDEILFHTWIDEVPASMVHPIAEHRPWSDLQPLSAATLGGSAHGTFSTLEIAVLGSLARDSSMRMRSWARHQVREIMAGGLMHRVTFRPGQSLAHEGRRRS